MKSELAFNPRRVLRSISAVITLYLYSHSSPHWNSSFVNAQNWMARVDPDIQTSTEFDNKWFCQHLKKKTKTTRGDAEEWECPCLPLNWSHNSVPILVTPRGGAEPKSGCVWCYRNNFCFPPLFQTPPHLKVSCKELLCVMRVISLNIILSTTS